MKASLAFGPKTLSIEVPRRAMVLETRPAPPLADPEAAVAAALAAPLGAPPLAELARGRRSACIVISDITRPVPNQAVLRPMLRILEQAGMAREDVVILIATGMHRPNQGAELESMVGPEIASGWRIENHFCRDRDTMRLVGRVEECDIELNKLYLDADLKILTGLIEPHMYAGYSGGRKSVLPGISSFATMQYMHSFQMIDHPKVANCQLEGNPFHEAAVRVARLAGCDLLANVVIDKGRNVVGVFAGDLEEAHLAGCAMAESLSVHRLDSPADLVITSAGGAPLDATFYQVSKGLINARNMVRPGGTILMACHCAEGLGSSEYCSMVRRGCTPGEFFGQCCQPQNFVIDQWCLQTTYQALAHADVHVHSPLLDPADLGGMGITPVPDLQEAVDRLCSMAKEVVVVPDGPYVVGLLRS